MSDKKLKSLQARLASSMEAVGYKKDVGTLPSSLEQNKQLFQFAEWAVSQIHPDNYLTPDECRSYEDLKSAGKIVEGEPLEIALKKLGQETQKTEDVEKEVKDLGLMVSSLKKQLQTLNSVQTSLNDHYGSLLHKRDDLIRKKMDMQKHRDVAQQKAKESDKQVDAALEDLVDAVKDLCTFHEQDRAGQKHPKFLSDVSQEKFHQAEDRYLSELTAYTKKQFFKGLADLAHFQAPGEEDTKFAEVDLDDPAQVILKGVTEEQHQNHREELSRLQAIYPVTELQCMNTQLAGKCAQARIVHAKKRLEDLDQNPVDSIVLRNQFEERQRKIEELKAKVHEYGRTQITGLLQEMAALQVTRVLHGDYDLKIARQDYFTLKQEKVISHLRSQRSRHELLSMLYEVELRKHRDTHRLLSAAESHFTEMKEGGNKRMAAMENPSLRHIESPRLSIDSKDLFALRLCEMLGVKQDSDSPFLTHAGLIKAVEQLVHQVATLEDALRGNDEEMKCAYQEQEALTGKFEKGVFGHNGDKVGHPVLTVQDYVDHCLKLSTVVTSLELNIKQLLNDYNGKKKVLNANPLLGKERMLFVHFFTDPSKLNEKLAELGRRVDSMALANANTS